MQVSRAAPNARGFIRAPRLAAQMHARRALVRCRAGPVMHACQLSPFWQEFCVNMAATYLLATSIAGTIQLARAIREDEHDNDEDSPL